MKLLKSKKAKEKLAKANSDKAFSDLRYYRDKIKTTSVVGILVGEQNKKVKSDFKKEIFSLCYEKKSIDAVADIGDTISVKIGDTYYSFNKKSLKSKWRRTEDGDLLKVELFISDDNIQMVLENILEKKAITTEQETNY